MDENTKNCFEFDLYHEGDHKILKIYLEKCSFPPSIEYSEQCMSKVIDLLLTNSGITNIILSQQREYDYDYSQVKLLVELASLYRKLSKDERFKYSHIVVDPIHEKYIRNSYAGFQTIISKKLKEDENLTDMLIGSSVGDYYDQLHKLQDNYFDAIIDAESLYCNSFERSKEIVKSAFDKLKTGGCSLA